jgi:protein-L-isoaspartate O-methyltransferase
VPQARAPLGPLAPGALLPDRDAVALLPYLRPTAKDALLIGLGAGLHARALSAHGIAATTIELDPALVSVASDLLGYDGDVIVGDGRVVARRLSRVFDGVVVDAFTGETPPAHLATIEAFRCFRERLTSEGVLFVHMIDRPSGGAALAVARTAAEVFASVRLLRTRATDDMQDLHLVASDGGVTPPPHPDLIAAGWPVYPRDVVVVPPRVSPGDDANAFEALDAAAARERRARALSERKR